MNKPKYLLPSVYLHPLKKIYAEHFIDPVRMLSIVGLPPATLHATNLEIDHVKYVQLVNESAKVCNEPLMGFLIGREFQLNNIGYLGILLSHQKVLSNIYPIIDYLFNHQRRGAHHYLKEQGSRAFHYIEFLIEDLVDCKQAALLTISAYQNFFSEILGERWQSQKVYLRIRQPAKYQLLEKHFGCPVLFEQAHDAIEFSAKLSYEESQAEVGYSNEGTKEINLALQSIPDLGQLVTCYIDYFLNEKRPTKHDVADSLGVHPKFLQKQLNSRGLTFNGLLEQCIFSRAKTLLMDTEFPISQIAIELGYSDARAFIRPFKKWSGYTPLQWRKHHFTH